MFLKPFKVKSNSAIKGSDRKRLRNDLSKQFPTLTAQDLAGLVPNKEEMSTMKLTTHGGEQINAFFLQKNPVFFEHGRTVYPTVYTLWRFPDLLPSFTTWPPVLRKLSSGADLMLPGMITVGKYGPTSFGRLAKGDPCCVNLSNNKAPIAVGRAAISSDDMFMSGKRGKGVIVLHMYEDQLWMQGDKSSPPSLDSPLPKEMVDDSNDDEEKEANSDTESPSHVEGPQLKNAEDFIAKEIPTGLDGLDVSDKLTADEEADEDEDEESEKSPAETMDELLCGCFLQAWKTNAKKIDLPILTSTFYKAYMVPCCPRGKALDVKKSTYKKLSKFLLDMQMKQIIEVKELSKGVESITGIDFSHPDIRSFVVVDEVDELADSDPTCSTNVKYEPPEITEMFTITSTMMPIFEKTSVRKGDGLTALEIRQYVTDYVKKHELQSKEHKSIVTLNDFLRAAVLKREEKEIIGAIRWDELMTRCFEKMKPAFLIRFRGKDPILKKGSLEPIELSIAQRAGNKKVTLVHNLEVYGIDPQIFAHTVQIGVAASTSVYPAPNRKEGSEVLIQGNQVKFIAKLLLDEYKINKRYIKGLENTLKHGKKR